MMPSRAKIAKVIAKHEADKKKRVVVGVLPSDGSVALMVDDLIVIKDHVPLIGFVVERWPDGHIEVHPLGADGVLDDDEDSSRHASQQRRGALADVDRLLELAGRVRSVPCGEARGGAEDFPRHEDEGAEHDCGE